MTSEASSLLRDLEEQKALMIAVSTGGPKIQEKNAEYGERRRRIRDNLQQLGMEDPNSFSDLWQWYGKWSAGEMPTYASRRAFVGNLYSQTIDRLAANKAERRSEPVAQTPESTPRVFFSYSHDSDAHKAWVRDLATRLRANGVDVILDQWDLKLGSDLPTFMETSLTAANRVVAVCTESYVFKANLGKGGVGYEKMILTARLMQDISSDRIIPVIRDNRGANVVPTFLGSRIYVDFGDDSQFESKYQDLVRDIHRAPLIVRPPLGPNPFAKPFPGAAQSFSPGPERYVASASSGRVTFDYSNNNGRFVVGVGDYAFETMWSSANDSSVHAYNNPPKVPAIALAQGVREIADIQNALAYDFSSRTRMPCVGEIVVWRNAMGHYLATKIMSVRARTHGSSLDELMFEYAIAENGRTHFRAQRKASGLEGLLPK